MDASIWIHLKALSEIDSGKELFLVGGSIRDHLLGKECSDFDFTAQNVAKIARRFATDTQSPFVRLDLTPGRETFRVVLEKQFNFDFTEMQGTRIEEDLRQRDFTINAMAIPLADFLEKKESFIDPNQGLQDLKNKTIRVVQGPVFSSDPCRMLRAFRFASALDFKIEPGTLGKIKSEKANLQKTAAERIYHEWILFLGGQQVYDLLRLMDETGLLEYVLPETAGLRNTFVGQVSAWELSLNTFQQLENLIPGPETGIQQNSPLTFLSDKRTALLKFSGLIHRLTPPSSSDSSISKGKMEAQSDTVRLLTRLRASNADIQFIVRTILCRQEAMDSNLDFAGPESDESQMYQFVKNHESELMSGIFLACAIKSAIVPDDDPKLSAFYQAAHRVAEFYFERYLPAMDQTTLLNGSDLMKQFNLAPSPLFRIILDRVEEARVLGSIHSKNEAAQVARQIIQTHQVP